MASSCELLDLPSVYTRDAIDEIAKNEKMNDIKIIVTEGSNKGDNYLGQILRVKVTGVRECGKSDSIDLILKIAPTSVRFRNSVPVELLYKREMFAYTNMLPVLCNLQEEYKLPQNMRFNYAKLYKAINIDSGEILIFQDLCSLGFKMFNRKKPFDYEHLCFTVNCLANFHATSFVLKARDPEEFNKLASNVGNNLDFGGGFTYYMGKCAEKLLTIINDPDDMGKILAFLGRMSEDLQRMINIKTAEPYNVLCHGDCWSNNFLYFYKNGKVCDMRMLDWQVIRCASPVTDIAYLLFTSMDEDMRNKHYEEILELYYDTLSNNISKMGYNASTCYPKHIYKEQIKSTMVYGLIMAIGILPLTLADKENTPNLGQLLDKDFAYEGKDLVYSDKCVERMQDLIKFCIKEKMI